MEKLVKELERSRYKSVMYGAALAFAEAKSYRLAYEIEGVKGRSKGGKADQRSAVNRSEVATGRERAKAKRLHNSLEKEEVLRDRLIDKLQIFRRVEDDFDWSM